MTLVEIEGKIIQMPDFRHDFGINDSSDPKDHVFTGNWRRHRGVEQPLVCIREFIENLIGDSHESIIDFLDIPIAIILGLNCSFPPKDIAQFVIWRQKGYRAIAVFDAKTRRRIH